MSWFRAFSPLLAFSLLAAPSPSSAEEVDLGWSDQAELTYVLTGGNAKASTLGLQNTLEHRSESATFSFTVEALRAESTTSVRTAVGTADDFKLDELEVDEVTAERYQAALRYDRDVSEAFFWTIGLESLKNELAGIDLRTVAQAGVGHVILDEEQAHLKTRYALTWSREETLVGASDDFLGLRIEAEGDHEVGEVTTLGSKAVVDLNLDDTDDLRLDWDNWVAVAMSERLALKVGLQLLYDNQPALAAVPLFAVEGGSSTGTVPVELDELDTIFQAALIVTF